MSKLNHTPGPWVLCSPEEYPWLLGDGTREHTLTILGSDGYGVLSVPISITDNYPNSPTAMANARLMTAAPEMLDYLISEARDLWTQQRIDDIGVDELRLATPIALVESATGKTIEEVLK